RRKAWRLCSSSCATTARRSPSRQWTAGWAHSQLPRDQRDRRTQCVGLLNDRRLLLRPRMPPTLNRRDHLGVLELSRHGPRQDTRGFPWLGPRNATRRPRLCYTTVRSAVMLSAPLPLGWAVLPKRGSHAGPFLDRRRCAK